MFNKPVILAPAESERGIKLDIVNYENAMNEAEKTPSYVNQTFNESPDEKPVQKISVEIYKPISEKPDGRKSPMAARKEQKSILEIPPHQNLTPRKSKRKDETKEEREARKATEKKDKKRSKSNKKKKDKKDNKSK